MLLLTMREWFGPSRAAIRRNADNPRAAEVRLRGFVTRLPLGQAIRRIHAYEQAFNARYAAVDAIEFELVHVASITELTEAEVEMSRAVFVEHLDETLAEMNARWGD